MISVIIPIFNVEGYLNQCLESVVAQDFEDIEVIGVDDCSQDGSVKIFESYLSDSRFKLIGNEENIGLPGSRNVGLYHAQGDYVYFLDSDDWIAPRCFSLLHSVATCDNSDIAIGGVLQYLEDTDTVFLPANHRALMEKTLKGETIFERPHLAQSVVSWNKLIRTDFIEKTGLLFKPSPRRFEDMLTYKWYLSGATVSSINQATYFYRQRSSESTEQSIMQQSGLSVMTDKLLSLRDMCDFMIKKDFFGSDYDPLNSRRGTMYMPGMFNRLSSMFIDQIRSLPSENAFRDDHIQFVVAFSDLMRALPDEYVFTLSRSVRCVAEYASENSAISALRRIRAHAD